MKHKKEQLNSDQHLVTILDKSSRIEGERLRVDGSLNIAGHVIASILCRNRLVLEKEGIIDGDLQAHDIILKGQVNGNIIAKGRLEITSTARVDGGISADKLSIEDGAVCNFIGNVGDMELNGDSLQELEDTDSFSQNYSEKKSGSNSNYGGNGDSDLGKPVSGIPKTERYVDQSPGNGSGRSGASDSDAPETFKKNSSDPGKLHKNRTTGENKEKKDSGEKNKDDVNRFW